MRHSLRITGWSLVWLGVFILAYAGYQMWGTNLIADRSQEQARQELSSVLSQRRETLPPPVSVTATTVPAPTTPTTSSPPTTVAAKPILVHKEEAGPVGQPVGRIRIPKINLDQVLFEGVNTSTLKKGPGHMPWTPLPGQIGNAVVSGHRVTYGHPFFYLDQVGPGDTIEVDTAIGTHVFQVRKVLVVKPTDVWVTDARRGAWLTLTTCNPRYSARQRLVVVAELVSGPNYDYAQALKEEVVQRVS